MVPYGDAKVSTGTVSPGKRVAVQDRYKPCNLFKINDNNKVALAA